jgi:hypothetical protein
MNGVPHGNDSGLDIEYLGTEYTTPRNDGNTKKNNEKHLTADRRESTVSDVMYLRGTVVPVVAASYQESDLI